MINEDSRMVDKKSLLTDEDSRMMYKTALMMDENFHSQAATICSRCDGALINPLRENPVMMDKDCLMMIFPAAGQL